MVYRKRICYTDTQKAEMWDRWSDEVHRILIAKNVLKHYRNGESWDFGI